MQSPTDGDVANHHFAESGVMELVKIILKVGLVVSRFSNQKPEKVILKILSYHAE
ncbi:MAG: hypothetical protein JJ892_05800 [Balneola sp.]|nr:hypothetical protein [Balneola sp.]MBO6799775.1 hypothetical protein [Balneola sp.]MBO6870784.1 hypothetical protein [Balneola sp.]